MENELRIATQTFMLLCKMIRIGGEKDRSEKCKGIWSTPTKKITSQRMEQFTKIPKSREQTKTRTKYKRNIKMAFNISLHLECMLCADHWTKWNVIYLRVSCWWWHTLLYINLSQILFRTYEQMLFKFSGRKLNFKVRNIHFCLFTFGRGWRLLVKYGTQLRCLKNRSKWR